jgi:hypothetical protein
VQYLAFAHGPDVISGEGENGGGIPPTSYEFDLESICRVAMDHGANVALLEFVFRYVTGEDDCFQFFDHDNHLNDRN